MNSRKRITKKSDVFAVTRDERIIGLVHVCELDQGILGNLGSEIYQCRRETGGCGKLYDGHALFPLPQAVMVSRGLFL